MATAAAGFPRNSALAGWFGAALFRPLFFLIASPALLFFATLAAMLFRPPDLHFYNLDRFALALLAGVVVLRMLVFRQPLHIIRAVALPLLLLIAMALWELVSRPSQSQDWSTFAAKWLVPFLLFQISQLVFTGTKSLKQFEIFLLLALAYLSLMAVFFLLDAKALIFPRFILDESIGIHADRARGPFLQAVANGVSLIFLGLVALDSYRRGRLRGIFALAFALMVPAAILATKTRSVWIAFAGAVVSLWIFSSSRRIRRACAYLTAGGVIAASATCLVCLRDASFGDRLSERSPVEFRFSMYRAGWEMFQEKPLFGWHADDIQPELAKRVDGFHQEQFFFHNSYLEVAVNYGVVGFVLYLWVLVDLFRLGRKTDSSEGHFMDRKFRALWPVFVGVYLLNASFVVMNYQFVNGLLFTLAGILAMQNRKSLQQSHGNFDA
ncbi:MAG TPA: O-antigen ligase family protein [Terriglobales bacterium]|nr:O-antigen ligase family protein [Terriglobales bacterium]